MAKATNQSFTYAHLMRWEPVGIEGGEGPAWIKTLSKDPVTNARTVLVRFGQGYRQKKAATEAYADIYVLEGEMTCGETLYSKDTYHYRPENADCGPIFSRTGITRLMIISGRGERCATEEVFVQDVKELPWEKDFLDPKLSISRMKLLRKDKRTDVSVMIQSTFMVGSRALVGRGHVHNHPEEAYVLEGENEDYLEDIDGHIRWIPGAYVCRQPDTGLHGDKLTTVVPLTLFIKRVYVEDYTVFHHRPDLNVERDIPRVTFVE